MAEKGEIRITAVGTTDVGRVREHNEDSLLVADLTARERAASGEPWTRDLGERGFLLAVADGMGGAASGELASEMAIETLHESLAGKDIRLGEGERELVGPIEESLKAANEEIYEKAQAEAEHRGMGTTMTAVLALGDSLTIAQVGDSRAYLMRKGKLVQVTKDQSLISQLIEEGTLTEEEADKLGGRNIILQALGVERDLDVDFRTLELLDGDVLVLCSDGLSGMMKDEEIETVIAGESDLRTAAARLITKANEAGGKDNITVILARFEGPGLRAPLTPLDEVERPGQARRYAPTTVPVEGLNLRKLSLFGGGGVAVAIVLILLLSGGGNDVTFAFPAPGAKAVLRPVEGGEPIIIEVEPGRKAGTVRDLPPGQYYLSAELAGYRALKDRRIEIPRGADHLEVPIVGKPGSLKLVPGTPHVHVRIERVHRKSWEPEYLLKDVSVGTGPRKVAGVASGELSIVVTREGFQPGGLKSVVLPAGEQGFEVRLPVLTSLTGTLEVHAPAGASVAVRYEYGDGFEGVVPGNGILTGRVRVGTHVLEVRHPEYRLYRDKVTIADGRKTLVRNLPLTLKEGGLVVHGPANGTLFLMDPAGKQTVRMGTTDGSGTGRLKNIPPGRYLLRLKTPEGKTIEKTVSVPPGRDEAVDLNR